MMCVLRQVEALGVCRREGLGGKNQKKERGTEEQKKRLGAEWRDFWFVNF